MDSERIYLQRAVAVVTSDEVVVHPARTQLIGAVIEVALAGLAVAAIVFLFDALPLWVLMLLLLFSIILGPIGVLNFVYGVLGTAFVMKRETQSAQWQQGFLGMGIGTTEYLPFARLERVAVVGDADRPLPSGERQDVVQYEVRLVKDNGRELTVGTLVAARPVGYMAARDANRLATALAELAGQTPLLARVEVPVEEGGVEAASTAPARPRRRYRRISGSGEAEAE